MQRRPLLTKPRQSPPRGLPGQTLEATASGHQGAEDETVRAHPGGRQGARFLLVPWPVGDTRRAAVAGHGRGRRCHGRASGSLESFRYRCPRALLGGHKGPSRGTSHATRRPAVFPPGLLPPYGAVGDNVRFSFFFFFFGRRRQDERGCGDGFPSDSVWLRLAVVSVCSPRTHEQREEARGRERGQCWPPRPAARPAPRADRRARAGDGDRKAACPRSRREPRAPPWAPAACP